MISLLCAVPREIELLRASMAIDQTTTVGSVDIRLGRLADRRVALCAGGMGKANAAHAATLLIMHSKPEAIIIFGIGGAYTSSGARIGDIAIATEEISGDDGVLTPEGFKDTNHIGIPLVTGTGGVYYNSFPAPDRFVALAQNALSGGFPEAQMRSGRFVTVSTCTGTDERARELDARYRGLCENMEGAAAAQVALLHQVPWMELRSISNLVEKRDPAKWDIPRAAQTAQEAVLRILEGWQR